MTDPRVLRRRVLWALLGGGLLGTWGVGWDIRWHILIGRDSFWIAPHVMTYTSVAAAAALSLGVLVLETWRARAGRAAADTVAIVGLHGTRGFHLAWWGIALTILAAPIDDLWHRAFGIDVTLWSPPHLLGFAGADLHGLGCLLIALEAWPAASRARLVALTLGATLIFGDFQVVVDQSVQTAFRRGGVFFFTWAILGALLFSFLLVLATRLTDSRAMPLVVAAGAVAAQVSVIAVADAGFALLRPTPMIEETIAKEPTSPVAIAHEMARLNGVPPGRSLMLRFLPLLPAALLAWADGRRRWRLASLAFGAGLVAVSGAMLARSPALRHAVPTPSDAVLALALAVAAAIVAGWCATRLADALRAIPPRAVTPEGQGLTPKPLIGARDATCSGSPLA